MDHQEREAPQVHPVSQESPDHLVNLGHKDSRERGDLPARMVVLETVALPDPAARWDLQVRMAEPERGGRRVNRDYAENQERMDSLDQEVIEEVLLLCSLELYN